MQALPVVSNNAPVANTLAVCIGRFSMAHREHERMFAQMAKERTHCLVLLGSANRIISPKNPFSFEQRKQFVTAIFAQFMDVANLRVLPLNDRIYSEGRWETSVQRAVDAFAEELDVPDKRIGMYGNEKDRTGYWHRNFPQWKQVDIGLLNVVNATHMRKLWLEQDQQINDEHNALQYLPAPMKDYLRNAHVFNPALQSDHQEYVREGEKFKVYPYRGEKDEDDHLNVMCGDVILECAGHVLTITRSASPGMGAKAWPGGHKRAWESSVDCAIRELYEETSLRIPERVLRANIRGTHLFDHPARNIGSVSRSSVGVHIKLEPRDDGKLPLAKGGDDAKNDHLPHGGCEWIKIEDILSGKVKLFDDHSDMLDFFHR